MINLSSKSRKEEVADFFVENFNVIKETKELVIKEDISGDVLPYLQKEDFKSLEINFAREKRIKDYLENNKDNFEDEQITEKITINSSEEEVKLFLERYIHFNSNEDVSNLNGKNLLELNDEQMKNKGMNIGQRRKLEKYIKYFKELKVEEPKIEYETITETSNKEDVSNYLRFILKLSEESLKEFEDQTGIEFFSCKESEIDKMSIIEKDKEAIKNIIKNNTKKEQIEKPSGGLDLKIKNKPTNMNIDGTQKKEDNESNIKSENKNYFFLKTGKVEKISKQFKYGVFFIMTVKKSQINNMTFSTCEEIVEKKKKLYNNFNYRFINAKEISAENESIKILMVQVPMNQPIKKLTFTLKYKDEDREKTEEYEGNFEVKFFKSKKEDKKNFYCFNINNLKYKEHNEEQLEINDIYNEYLNFFLNNKENYDEERNKDLIMSLRDYIKNSNVELSAETILFLFKMSLECKVKFEKFDNIKLKQIKGKNEFKYNYDLSNINIDKLLGLAKNEKDKFINLIIKIYSVSDIYKLIELIKSDEKGEYCKALLNLIDKKDINIENLIIDEENERILFQSQLLDKSKKEKKMIEIILKLSGGITNCLYFVVQNFDKIYNILKDTVSKFFPSQKTKEAHYLINIENHCNEEDIDKIYVLLSTIKQYSKEKKYKYEIIDNNKIFEILLIYYSNKSIEDLCKLRNILQLTSKENESYNKNQQNLDDKIHDMGINLIRNKKLTSDKIIFFITEQDAYYFQKEINDIKKKNPEILRNIPITNVEENYLENIELMKDKKLWKIIVESKEEIKIKFCEVLLEQIKNVNDLKSIFDIFPIDEINKSFTGLINKKMQEIKYIILDKKKSMKISYLKFMTIY